MNVIPAFPKPSPAAQPPSRASQTRIPQLDGLRGIAVLSVVLYHYSLSISLPPHGLLLRLQGCFQLGAYGVDLFFVLSGFLIGGILLDSKQSPRYFRTFYFRRFHRIFPLYYLWLGLYVILAFRVFRYLPPSIRAVWPGWRPTLVYAFFAQNLVFKNLQGISAAWLGPLWSLAVEEQFYLLMPLAVRFLSKRRLVQLLVAALLLSPLLRVAFSRWTHVVQYTATPLRADALAMGVLLAFALREEGLAERIRQNLKWLYATIVMLSVAVLCFVARPLVLAGRWDAWGFSWMGLLFAAGILLALIQPYGWWSHFCKQTALRNLGGISYCIYVIHLAVNTICYAILHSLYGTRSVILDLLSVLVAWAATLILAKISWNCMESPMVRRGHAYRYYPDQ
jgi:peptidoglycan/LPS O-acetylase OafA/YrhL